MSDEGPFPDIKRPLPSRTQAWFFGETPMKFRWMIIGFLTVLAMPANGQGVVGGAQQGASQGARQGSKAAGPVGGAVGGAVGGTVGGVTGGVKGALGVPSSSRHKSKKSTSN